MLLRRRTDTNGSMSISRSWPPVYMPEFGAVSFTGRFLPTPKSLYLLMSRSSSNRQTCMYVGLREPRLSYSSTQFDAIRPAPQITPTAPPSSNISHAVGGSASAGNIHLSPAGMNELRRRKVYNIDRRSRGPCLADQIPRGGEQMAPSPVIVARRPGPPAQLLVPALVGPIVLPAPPARSVGRSWGCCSYSWMENEHLETTVCEGRPSVHPV